MASVNTVILVGNVVRKPEARFTASGTAVCNLTVATNEVWSDKQGQKHERAEFHRIVSWGKQAETCAEFLDKGRQVYVEGSLRTRQWTDKNGQERYTTEVQATKVLFLGARPQGTPAAESTELPPEVEASMPVDPEEEAALHALNKK
jgi:single-strand DNA-binding protein